MTRFYLLFSAVGLTAIALSYGVVPAKVLPEVLDVTVEGTDLTHVFRAIMGLYLGLVVLWVCGAFRSNLTRPAVVSEVTFMLGLAAGRLLSIVVDGVPSLLLVIYALLELGMGAWGIVVWKQLDRDESSASPAAAH